MKVTFELPDAANATQEQVKNAIAYAQAVFEESLNNSGEVTPEESSAADLRQEILKNRDRGEIEEIVKELVQSEELRPVFHQEYDDPMTTEPQPEDKDSPDYVGMEKYRMGMPNDDEFKRIMLYLPNKGYGAKKEDFIVASFVASNNFVWRSYGKWSLDALKTMCMQYGGRPYLYDHSDKSEDVIGFVYDSEYQHNTAVKRKYLEAVNPEANMSILNTEGYVELITKCAFPKDSEYVQGLRMGKYNDVSTGSLVDTNKYKCPIDGTYFGQGKRWYQCEHGHNMPSPSLIYWFYDEEEIENMAPYYEVEKVTDTIELSNVTMGNLPAAMMIKDR